MGVGVSVGVLEGRGVSVKVGVAVGEPVGEGVRVGLAVKVGLGAGVGVKVDNEVRVAVGREVETRVTSARSTVALSPFTVIRPIPNWNGTTNIKMAKTNQ